MEKGSAERVFVCGAGHQGLSMAAHLTLNGVSVNLWNRSPKNIEAIMNTGIIHCDGVVHGDARLSKVSSNITDVVEDFVMVATPSTAHKDIARELAPFVREDMVVILNPGRTFGAIEFAEELKKLGVNNLPHIAETQTIVYTCRKVDQNRTNIFALKHDVEIATLKGMDLEYILQRIPKCLEPYFKPVRSVAYTSLSNIGMILHCAPVLMNTGWIECEKTEFKYYYDGMSKHVVRLLEKMDTERQNVAKALGFEVESLKGWLQRTYSVSGNTLLECIRNNDSYREIDAPPTLNTRYIFEDVPNGLVPVETLGKEYGIPTPNISTIVDLACSVMDEDYRTKGRRFTSKQLEKYY